VVDPVTTRAPSPALAKMAPPWIGMRRLSPSRTSSNASSPSTKTALSLRKCTATTAASAGQRRVRSTTEGVSGLVCVMIVRLRRFLDGTARADDTF
jgi:hypothetical protein